MSDNTATLEPVAKTAKKSGRDRREDRVITLPMGLVGLPDLKRWVLKEMHPPVPLRWLVSLDRPGFRVPVGTPDLFAEEYDFELPADARRVLGVTPADSPAVLVISTIHPGGDRITGNLAAPLVIDPRTRTGVQAVLDDRKFGLHTEMDVERFRIALARLRRESSEESRIAALLGQVELARRAQRGDDLPVEI